MLEEPLVGNPESAFFPTGQDARRCRDVPWLVVLLLCWLGLGCIASIAVAEGDPRRLTAGMDYSDQLCGTMGLNGADLRDRPFVYFSCLPYGRRHPTICVSECPHISGHYVKWYNGTVISCPLNDRTIPSTTYPSVSLQHNCVPSAASLYALVSTRIDETTFPSVIAGINKATQLIAVAALVAAILASSFVYFVRLLADSEKETLPLITVLFATASLAVLTASLWLHASEQAAFVWSDYDPIVRASAQVATNTDMIIGLAVLVSAFALGVAVALWCGLLERLMLTGGIIREACEAFVALPALVILLPPLVLVGIVGLFSYWQVVSSYIASAGSAVPLNGMMRYDSRVGLFFAFQTTGILWTAECLLNLAHCATAGVVVRWYFGSSLTVERPSLRKGALMLLTALMRTLRYSTGSLALGALLIVPGRCFRFCLEHCLHQAQTDGGGKPELRSVASCCLRCCLDAGTRYLQYMSHNAYVLVSVHDVTFCEGARQAFELTLSNIGQVSVLTAGERLLLTLIKLGCACLCTAFVAVALPLAKIGAADNASGALLVVFLLTFSIADAWVGIVDSAVEAIFLCYLVDRAENDGDMRPYYASATLRRYMERHRPTYKLPSYSVDEEVSARGDRVGSVDSSQSAHSASSADEHEA